MYDEPSEGCTALAGCTDTGKYGGPEHYPMRMSDEVKQKQLFAFTYERIRQGPVTDIRDQCDVTVALKYPWPTSRNNVADGYS